MNGPSQQQRIEAPSPVGAGSSTEDHDHPDVSSCFVSSPSSSTTSSPVLDSRFVAAGGTAQTGRAQHQHQHQNHQRAHHPPPPSSVQARPSHLLLVSAGRIPHLNVANSQDDDSLRVSSSTLFHDGADTTTGSSLTAPDSPVAGTSRPSRPHPTAPEDEQSSAPREEEEGSSPVRAPSEPARQQRHHSELLLSGEERTHPAPRRRDGLDPASIAPPVDDSTMHSDVYECLCSPEAAASSRGESDGIGIGGFFAPQNFKRTLANTLLERMRSRADTTSAVLAVEVCDGPDPHADHKKSSSPMAVLDEMEERMLRDTGLAKKRVRVVQLLIVGLVSLLFGWLGNFFVTSSCHFASSTVSVGQYSEPFEMHYGLWKYSPVDSALSGSYSCYPYHSAQHRAPVVARIANFLALLLGTYSQMCVWAYLIAGRWHPQLWRAAVHTAAAAGVLQLLTLCFFVERVCWSNHCRMGPASVVAVTTALVWFVFAWEVHYNTPRGPESIVSLEMRDLRRASAEYMTRFQPEKAAGYYRPPKSCDVPVPVPPRQVKEASATWAFRPTESPRFCGASSC